ncbi:MAG: hypothetical protein NUV84_05515 [Candidatus Uhrbacteria bacterium]|nr:hypothetical protein [Candidatus Uhrbacteria bacterium]
MKKMVVTLIVLGLVGVGVWGVISSERSEESRDFEVRDSSTTPTQNDSSRDDAGLTQANCSDAGGTWNPCGSACRTDPDAICIELCVEYCECQSETECPSGYTCGDVMEGVGVCL